MKKEIIIKAIVNDSYNNINSYGLANEIVEALETSDMLEPYCNNSEWSFDNTAFRCEWSYHEEVEEGITEDAVILELTKGYLVSY